MGKIQDIITPQLQFAEGDAPGTPASGVVRIYAKADGLLYSKDDAGNETCLGGAVEVFTAAAHALTDHTGITGCSPGTLEKGIAFYIDGELEVGTNAMSFVVPMDLTVTGGKLAVSTAPTDASLICDINKNGTTLWTTQGNRPTIAAAGSSASITAPDVTSLAQGDVISLDIDQVGSTIAGANLSLTLYCEVA